MVISNEPFAPLTLLRIWMAAERVPEAEGLKSTVKVALAPGFRDAGIIAVLTVKSPGLAPSMLTAEMVSALAPLGLVIVNVSVKPPEPMPTLPTPMLDCPSTSEVPGGSCTLISGDTTMLDRGERSHAPSLPACQASRITWAVPVTVRLLPLTVAGPTTPKLTSKPLEALALKVTGIFSVKVNGLTVTVCAARAGNVRRGTA